MLCPTVELYEYSLDASRLVARDTPQWALETFACFPHRGIVLGVVSFAAAARDRPEHNRVAAGDQENAGRA